MKTYSLKKELFLFGALALLGASNANANQKITAQDLKEYATAVCLIEQKDDPYLKEQGFSWSSILVHGSSIALEALAPIDEAVKNQFAKSKMITVRDEESPTGSKSMPLVLCVRIADSESVKKAINRTLSLIKNRRE